MKKITELLMDLIAPSLMCLSVRRRLGDRRGLPPDYVGRGVEGGEELQPPTFARIDVAAFTTNESCWASLLINDPHHCCRFRDISPCVIHGWLA